MAAWTTVSGMQRGSHQAPTRTASYRESAAVPGCERPEAPVRLTCGALKSQFRHAYVQASRGRAVAELISYISRRRLRRRGLRAALARRPRPLTASCA
jgi:hypothetical protein